MTARDEWKESSGSISSSVATWHVSCVFWSSVSNLEKAGTDTYRTHKLFMEMKIISHTPPQRGVAAVNCSKSGNSCKRLWIGSQRLSNDSKTGGGLTNFTLSRRQFIRFCQQHFLAIFLLATLSVIISLCYPFRLTACLSLREGLCIWTCPIWFLKFSFWPEVLKHVSASLTLRWGSCWCCLDFGVSVFGWLSSGDTMRAFHRVYNELGAFLSLAVYKVNVCSGKVILLCVCVLLQEKWVFWLLFFRFMF